MADQFQPEQISYELGLRLKDLEQGQKLMKERLLLIGQNLIESQEKNIHEQTELKKTISNLESDTIRLKETVLSLADELSRTARKEEIEILNRQFKMFQPLKFARIEDIEKIVNRKIKGKINKEIEEVTEKKEHKFWSGKL